MCLNENHMIVIGLLLINFIFPSASFADIRTPMVFPGRDDLIIDIIDLAMEKSSYQQNVLPYDEYLSDARLIEEVRNGNIDLIWAGASDDLQEKLQAIRIPIFKGLTGYRTLVINKNNQELFSGIKNIYDLKPKTAGLGRFWSDTKILESSGIKVVKPVKADSLFYMLDGGRFDYLPLGIHESGGVVDMQNKKGLNLAVEDNLLLVYPSAMYFYVSKENTNLYHILESGLEKAISDGSFDNLFYNSSLMKETFKSSKVQDRTVILLDNPLLPDDVPLDRNELWVDISRWSIGYDE